MTSENIKIDMLILQTYSIANESCISYWEQKLTIMIRKNMIYKILGPIIKHYKKLGPTR